MAKRKSISLKERFAVFARDGFRCRYCGHSPNDGETVLHVDHVIPVAGGGTNHRANLRTACLRCNLGKAVGPAGDPFDVVHPHDAAGLEMANDPDPGQWVKVDPAMQGMEPAE